MSKNKNSRQPNKAPKPATQNSNAPLAQPKSRQNRSGLGCSIAMVVALIGLGLAALIGAPRLLAFVDQTGTVASPVTDRTSPAALVERRNKELTQLQGYGWVDQKTGLAHIPVARAIALLAGSGLPVGAPEAASSQPISGTTADLSNVNYNDNIQPLFEQHCGKCHGADDPEEGLQLTTYKAAMIGSDYGAVIKPGDPDKSYLVEMVTTGKMPKKGPKLTPAEIAMIVAWIKAGAPEKGTAAPAAAAVDPAKVSFAKNILPLFQERCSKCHGGDEPEEGLVLTSYKDVKAGSIYGAVIKPGDPDNSYLIKMVSTGKMPKKGAKLTPAEIAMIVAWIKAGAPDN